MRKKISTKPYRRIHADFVSSFLLISEELSLSRILMPSLALCECFFLRLMRLEPPMLVLHCLDVEGW